MLGRALKDSTAKRRALAAGAGLSSVDGESGGLKQVFRFFADLGLGIILIPPSCPPRDVARERLLAGSGVLVLAHSVEIYHDCPAGGDQVIRGFHIPMGKSVLTHPHQIPDHRAKHLIDLLWIRVVAQVVCPDGIVSMFVDEPGSPTQTPSGLLHPSHRQRGHNADSGELLRRPEAVLRAGSGDCQPESVQGACAVVTLDDVACAVERRRGQSRFDILLDDLCPRLFKTCVGMGQQIFKQGRGVSGDQCAPKSLVLPRFDIVP